MTVTSTGRTVDQTSHRLVREALRETVRAGPGALERVRLNSIPGQCRVVPAAA